MADVYLGPDVGYLGDQVVPAAVAAAAAAGLATPTPTVSYIKAGADYSIPVVTMGANYSFTPPQPGWLDRIFGIGDAIQWGVNVQNNGNGTATDTKSGYTGPTSSTGTWNTPSPDLNEPSPSGAFVNGVYDTLGIPTDPTGNPNISPYLIIAGVLILTLFVVKAL